MKGSGGLLRLIISPAPDLMRHVRLYSIWFWNAIRSNPISARPTAAAARSLQARSTQKLHCCSSLAGAASGNQLRFSLMQRARQTGARARVCHQTSGTRRPPSGRKVISPPASRSRRATSSCINGFRLPDLGSYSSRSCWPSLVLP